MIMKKRVIIGSLAIFGLVSLLYDAQISQFFESQRTSAMDYVLSAFTFEISAFLLLFVFTSFFLFNENKKKWIIPLWITAFISIAVSFLLKVLVHRARPYQTEIISAVPLALSTLYATTSWNFSFPSFQAMIAFAAVPLLDKEFKKLKVFWLTLATIMAFSRVYFGVHYLSDVIFGGIIGYLIGFTILQIVKNKNN